MCHFNLLEWLFFFFGLSFGHVRGSPNIINLSEKLWISWGGSDLVHPVIFAQFSKLDWNPQHQEKLMVFTSHSLEMLPCVAQSPFHAYGIAKKLSKVALLKCCFDFGFKHNIFFKSYLCTNTKFVGLSYFRCMWCIPKKKRKGKNWSWFHLPGKSKITGNLSSTNRKYKGSHHETGTKNLKPKRTKYLIALLMWKSLH